MSRVFLIIFILGLYSYLKSIPFHSFKKRNKYFIIWTSIALIIDSGFRHLSVGPDTYQYYLMFEQGKSYSIEDLFKSTFHIGNYSYLKDAGYWLFQKIFQQVFPTFRLFLIFVAILFFSSLGNLLYRNVKSLSNLLVSYFFYIGMYWFFFSTTGTRQTIAVSIIMFAFTYLQKGSFLKYSFLVALASLFHTSAIVAFLGGFILFFKSEILYRYFLFPLVIVIFIGHNLIFANLVDFMDLNDEYGVYLQAKDNAASNVIMFFYLLVFSLCLLLRKELYNHSQLPLAIKLYYIGVCFLPTMFIAATAFRIVFYFSFSLFIIIPHIVEVLKIRNKYLMAIVLMIVLMLFSIRQTWDYKFFWQEDLVTSYGHTFMVSEDFNIFKE